MSSRNQYGPQIRLFLNESKITIGSLLEIHTKVGQEDVEILHPLRDKENHFLHVKNIEGYQWGMLPKSIISLKEIGFQPHSLPPNNLAPLSNKKTPTPDLLFIDCSLLKQDLHSNQRMLQHCLFREVRSIKYKHFQIKTLQCLTSTFYKELANYMGQEISSPNSNLQGIVIAHPINTLVWTAKVMQFMLQKVPIPIIFVGAQRMQQLPGSDLFPNLRAAAHLASTIEMAEILICSPLNGSSDAYTLLRPTDSEYLHSTHQASIRSPGTYPLALYSSQTRDYRLLSVPKNIRNTNNEFTCQPFFSHETQLVYLFPGQSKEMFARQILPKTKGLTIMSSGRVALSDSWLSLLKEMGCQMHIYFASRSIGRDEDTMKKKLWEKHHINIIQEISPESAFIKLSWILGQTQEEKVVQTKMKESIAGEFLETNFIDVIPLLGGWY